MTSVRPPYTRHSASRRKVGCRVSVPWSSRELPPGAERCDREEPSQSGVFGLRSRLRCHTLAAQGSIRVTFTYDYLGRRVWKVVETCASGAWTTTADREFIRHGWRPVLELDGTDGDEIMRKYTWGQDLSGSLEGAGVGEARRVSMRERSWRGKGGSLTVRSGHPAPRARWPMARRNRRAVQKRHHGARKPLENHALTGVPSQEATMCIGGSPAR